MAKCCKIRKKNIALSSLQILNYICITHSKAYHIRDESIFRILEDFVTKICNFTNFGMLFLAVVKERSFCSYCLDQNLVYQSRSWELSIETEIQPL